MASQLSPILGLTIIAGLAVFASGVLQEAVFYTETGQQGDAIVLRSSWRNFSAFEDLIRVSRSGCGTGYWYGFTLPNFGGTASTWRNGDPLSCNNNTTWIQTKNSMRRLAAPDTNTPAISLYSNVTFGAEEFYVAGVAGAYIPFDPKSYATSGRSSWTFFSGPNFDGTSTCVPAGSGNVTVIPSYTGIVHSVVRGCGTEAKRNVELFLTN